MDKKIFTESIKKLKEISPKRKFTQSIDLVINLKGIDLKKPEQKVDLFVILPYSKGKQVKICALVGNELASQAKILFDKTITSEEFQKYNEKKVLKKIASEFDYFIAQANLMGQIATVFGRTLGPRGKMPNPKAGCVVPPTAQITALKDRLQKTIHLQTKNDASLKASIGLEDMENEELAENAYSAFSSLIHSLPQEKANIKSVMVKTTMGPIVIVTDQGPKIKETKEVEIEAKETKSKKTNKNET
ncbi:MAG: 50S ribosomal protein L1 [Nanoarchaeota archaeon]